MQKYADLVNDKLASIGEKIGITNLKELMLITLLLIFMVQTVSVYW